MTTISLRGYDVWFPYEKPYGIQGEYMEKVIISLDERKHGVLESPTGTGKTLCLFAPVTAWARHKKYAALQSNDYTSEYFDNNEQGSWGIKRRPRVWYTSRTHSQIAQTISEVRKCNTDGLKIGVLGARDQLCINNLVLDEKDSYAKTVKCKELVKNKICKYYNKLSYEKDPQKYFMGNQVMDIEDLVSLGRSCGICPYFLAKRACDNSDIVLLPYNYIIDKESRDSNGIHLQNDVIIFDEGHNVPSTCEESYEFSFSSLEIALGIKNVKELMQTLSSLADTITEENHVDLRAHAESSVLLMNVLQKLETELENVPLTNELMPVSFLYEFLENAGFHQKTADEISDGILKMKNDSHVLLLSKSILETFKLLEKMISTVFGRTVRSFDKAIVEKSFKCGISIDPERMNKVKKLSLFCFNPSFGVKSLLEMGVQSIIITSGTLSPLRTFIAELGLPNPVTLENGHIAKKCQVPFVILGTGVNNVKMDGTYRNRNDPKYVSSLGMTLTNLIVSIPDGVLLLFSSYAMMSNLKQAWESDMGIWTRLNALKRVFIEPKNKEEFINCMENYKRAIDAGNGAVLLGVLRGKISEGMDFKDQYCRGVFIIGVPFPPVQDIRVQGKERYSESLTVINPVTEVEEKLYNNSFMSVEAMKATNQAIGRVIRHGQDYGVIILADYRFAWPKLFNNISGWLRGDSPIESNFPTTKKLVRDFFKNVHQGKLGFEEIRCQRVDSNGCPIASYVSYEEYDHKKHASQPVAWIGGDSTQDSKYWNSTQDSKPTMSTPRGSSWNQKPIAKRPRGHAAIEFDDEEEEDSKKLMSMYKTCSVNVFGSQNSGEHSGSLLEALESSRNSSVGYREFDKNFSESNKRKLSDEENVSQNSEEMSPSLLSFPDPYQKQKKYPRLKVRPLIPFGTQEESATTSNNGVANDENKNDEDLKVKLINYYRKVKQSLSPEHDKKFKEISCKYMKGEAALTQVIESMDELFLSPGKKNLFSEFNICVKGKDKEEWKRACNEREVDFA